LNSLPASWTTVGPRISSLAGPTPLS